MLPPIFIYIFFGFAALVFVYLSVLAIELYSGNRVASNFRLYLDEKIRYFLDESLELFGLINTKRVRALKVADEEIFIPIVRPIKEQYHKYQTLRTGKRNVLSSKTKVSLYLRKLKKLKDKNK